jgi:hypothetical protein
MSGRSATRGMRVLELFAGSRSVGKVAERMGCTVFSSDIEAFTNVHLVKNILDVEAAEIPFVPDFIWASPPCTFFSVASIGKHWTPDHRPKTENAKLGVRIVEKTLGLIGHFQKLNPDMKWFMENPRGKLRKLPVVFGIPSATVFYCQYGDSRMKPTDIWTNHLSTIFNPSGWIPRDECWNGNGDCHHEPAPRGSKTGTQGLKGSYERSRIPEALVAEILQSVFGPANLFTPERGAEVVQPGLMGEI